MAQFYCGTLALVDGAFFLNHLFSARSSFLLLVKFISRNWLGYNMVPTLGVVAFRGQWGGISSSPLECHIWDM